MSIDNPKSERINVTAIMAMSLNGRITKGTEADERNWTSKEDKDFFNSIISSADSVVMGINTFNATPKSKVPKYSHRLSVVLTHNPEDFSEYESSGIREFWDKSAHELVVELEKRGFKSALLLGGGGVNAEFFGSGLVDELWLTIEPKIFGSGKLLIEDFSELETNFNLESHRQLNNEGTLLLHYIKS
ncbi:MAG: dihydrofolate reductase family protein [bacterium]|nr:dihydrofolate reductase family protein [bacterium]